MLSHFGRPKGKRVPEMSLQAPLVEPLSRKRSARTVAFAEDCIGPKAEEAVRALKPGDVLLLENLRFHDGEEKNDPAFADAAGGARRPLRQRRLLRRAPRPCLDRGRGASAAGLLPGG